MKCTRHGKDILYNCNWCGKDLCERCDKKKSSYLKVYCLDCKQKLQKTGRATIAASA